MAEQKAAEPAAAAPAAAAPSGGKPIIYIIVLVLNMLVIGGIGFMIFSDKKKEEAKPTIDHIVEGEEKTHEEEHKNPEFIGKLIPLKTFIVNLAGARGQKLLKINIELEVNNDEVQKEIEKTMPKIYDLIINILTSRSYDQISTREGKDVLRDEIRDQVNLFLTKGQVARVYFTELIYN